jgi:hypothetical protein
MTHAAAPVAPTWTKLGTPQLNQACDAAVGPLWLNQVARLADDSAATPWYSAGVRVLLNCELASLKTSAAPAEWPLLATLTSGSQLAVDMVIAATGVVPCVEWCAHAWVTR